MIIKADLSTVTPEHILYGYLQGARELTKLYVQRGSKQGLTELTNDLRELGVENPIGLVRDWALSK